MAGIMQVAFPIITHKRATVVAKNPHDSDKIGAHSIVILMALVSGPEIKI